MVLHIGLDIGGTLTKVACVVDEDVLIWLSHEFSEAVMTRDKYSMDEIEISPEDLGFSSLGQLAFGMFSFTSRELDPLVRFLGKFLNRSSCNNPLIIPVTGGGALKYQQQLALAFPEVSFKKLEEMEAVVMGFSFLVQRVNSAFVFNAEDYTSVPVPLDEVKAPFPLLLVNIGSGVSMIKISSASEFTRVQGTPIGGGTVLGLGKALFNAESFEEIMTLSMAGDSSKVDLSVGELIGATPSDDFWNLDTVASSLTKLLSLDRSKVSRADLAQSIVRMVSYNIGYIAYLVASLHHCERIYFSGKYVNKHIPTMDAISYAVKFYENWKPPPSAEESLFDPADEQEFIQLSGNKCAIRFLHQEGYVGAIGALRSLEKCRIK